jgi:hypothetical protein
VPGDEINKNEYEKNIKPVHRPTLFQTAFNIPPIV